MGWAARKPYTHRVVTVGRLAVTRVAVTPLDPLVNTLRLATDDGWYDGRVVRLPSWTRVRTGLGVAVSRDVASVPWFLARLAWEVSVLALLGWLAVSSLV